MLGRTEPVGSRATAAPGGRGGTRVGRGGTIAGPPMTAQNAVTMGWYLMEALWSARFSSVTLHALRSVTRGNPQGRTCGIREGAEDVT
jgi:hypothetical protein